MHYKNHAKRSQEEKMHRMTGGAVHKKHKHSDEREDKHLVHEMVKPSALKHRAAGGPVEGVAARPRMDHGGKSKSGGGKKHGTHVNILVNPKMNAPGAGADMPPPDASGAPLPTPPGLGGGAGGPPLPPGGGSPMGPPMPMRKKGGRVGHYDAGAGSGEGRIEKTEEYGKNAKAGRAHQ